MTQEEKFKEAKRLYETANADQRYVLERLFPELAESEDERIRKEIISAIKEDWPGHTDWIAWIEKQAQKPDTNCLLSWSETDEKMLQSLEGIVKDYWAKAEQEKNEIKIREASNVSYFLKTIQKSPLCWIKCSNGLPNRDGTYLVVTDGRHNDVYDMARYDSIEGWHKASEVIYWMPIPQLNNKSIIEQKPAEWSEEDLVRIENCISLIGKTGDGEVKWLKDLKDRVQPQSQWKPSEQDILLLERIFDGKLDPRDFQASLQGIIEQLKKLMEE